MTLREEDFVSVHASWQPKHQSIADAAAALNLGIDSFVFVDDNPFECGQVRGELPQVTVLQVSGDPAMHVDTLLADGWFDAIELTQEDRSRVTRYQDESARNDFLHGFESIDAYLHELDIQVRLERVAEPDLQRVSQLTTRTNQFNLTTIRLQPGDVAALAKAPHRMVLSIHSRDRFGENGLVGAILIRWQDGTVHLDNFLLSCRVFSRGIEQACLSAVLRFARDTGAAQVLGSYTASAKNAAVRDFYPRFGFQPTAGDGTTLSFRHGLCDIVGVPEHLRLTADLLGGSLGAWNDPGTDTLDRGKSETKAEVPR
jgi:FkbH-like protein